VDPLASGSTGSAVNGGSGASAESRSGYAALLLGGTGYGAGGGGGGLYGGGGGGVNQSNVGGGGGGGGSSNVSSIGETSAPPSVSLGWWTSATTQTTLSVSSRSELSNGSVTATANISVENVTGVPLTGSVQFVVDNQPYGSPVPVSSGSTPLTKTASAQLSGLSVGQHTIYAEFQPSGSNQLLMESWSDGAALQVWWVSGAKYVFTKYPASDGLVLEVNGSNGGTDIWQQAGSGSSTQANEVWTFEQQPSGYGWLVNDANQQCLEVNGTTGAVDTWPCVDGAPNELWLVQDNTPDPANGQDALGVNLQVESSGENLGTNSADQALSNGAALAMYPGSGNAVSWSPIQVG
jgi:hypothetical protein